MHRLLHLLFLLLWAGTARAQSATLLPNGPLVADGVTTSVVFLHVPGLGGYDRVKIKPELGRIIQTQVAGPGVASFTYQPPAVEAPKVVSALVQIRGATLKLDTTIEIPVAPPYAGSVAVTFDPAEYVAGGGPVSVRFAPSGTSPQSAEARKFLATASAGTMGPVAAAGDGTYVAQWTPPEKLETARTVIVAAVDAGAPEAIKGWAVLPALARQPVTFEVTPGTNNVLSSGDRTWGPFPASPAGTVAFEVEVNPQKTQANLQSIAPDGTKTSRVVTLPLGDYDRVQLMPLPPALPADPKLSVKVRVVVVQRSGEPLVGATVVLKASAGQVTQPVATAEPGVYEATFSPSGTPGPAILTAEAEGHGSTQTIEQIAAMPVVSLSSDPAELPDKTQDATLTVRLKDAIGSGLIGQPPALSVEGGKLTSKVTDNQDGTYTAKVRIDSGVDRMRISATPASRATGLPPHRLLIWPAEHGVPATGTATVPVTIVALDAYGLPVPGVDIQLAVPFGDGTLPPKVTTDAQGLATVDYKAGATPGPATLKATGAGLWAGAVVFQANASSPAVPLVGAGDETTARLLSSWKSAAPAVVVARAGAVAKAGPPALVTISSVPPYTTPGAQLLLTALVTDAAGTAVSGKPPALQTTLGSIGPVSDNKDGTYTATLQLPAGQDGPVTIMGTSGAASGTLPLQTFAAAAAAPSGGGGGSARQPRQGGGGLGLGGGLGGGGSPAPWLRASFALATVPHTYSLSSSGQGDVPETASFQHGGALFGAPGFDLRGLAWPNDGAIGGEASMRLYFDKVLVGEDTYKEALAALRLAGRYRYDLGNDLFAYGLGGLKRQNALLFLYADSIKSSAEMLAMPITGGEIGGGVMYDRSPLYLDLHLTETFVPFPVNESLGLQVQYDTGMGVGVRAGMDFDFRHMTFDVDDEEVKVKDRERALTIGAVYMM